MLNGKDTPVNENGIITKVKPSKTPTVRPEISHIEFPMLLSMVGFKALISPPYSSSIAKSFAPWPRDQGEVSELYKVP